jgi:tRNA(Arg) A34 adenosine deaminase TadA
VEASDFVVLEAENTVVTGRDVTGHAELNLVRAASTTLDASDLLNATLYTSTEPCAMCSGAIYWSGIGRVVYVLSNEALMTIWSEAAASEALTLSCREVFARGGRGVDVSGPHLEKAARAVHEGFWS